MKRLTWWDGKKWVLSPVKWREAVDRLAAYENIGFEPEQITAMLADEDTDAPVPPLGDLYTAVIVERGKGGNVPYVDPESCCAYLYAAEVEANADNPEVIRERGVNHLVIEVYPDHWHVTQVEGCAPDGEMYTKIF